MRKKLLKQQFLLVLLTMLIAIPQGVWAEDYPITVAGVQVTDANASGVTGDNITGTVTFAPAEGNTPATLTLSYATINGSISISSAIEELAINLVGSNTLNGNITGSVINDGYTSLSFTGEGECSLKITTENSALNLISYKLASGLYLASDDPAPYIDYNGSLRGGDGSAVSSITISTTKTYPIWVCNTGSELTGYTQLTADDSSVNGTTGTASYNGSILTLTNFACTTTDGDPAFYIGQEIENLTVNLSGQNTINDGPGFSFVNANASLVLSANAQTLGSLILENSYPLTISNTLTLNNVSIEGGIVSYLENLTIHLVGNNKLNGHISGQGDNCTLNFTHQGESSLNIQDMEIVIYGFSDVTFDNGLNLASSAINFRWSNGEFVNDGGSPTDLTITTSAVYPIWISSGNNGYTQVTGENASNVLEDNNTPTVVFDGQNNQLTLNNATIEGNIVTSIDGLVIDMIGNNLIYSSGGNCIASSVTEQTEPINIYFKSTSDVKGGLKLSMGENGEKVYDDDKVALIPDQSILDLDFKIDVVDVYTVVIAKPYNLWVNGTQVTSANNQHILRDDPTYKNNKVSFDGNHTLTLHNIPGTVFNTQVPFVKNGIGNLTIYLDGQNEVNCGVFIAKETEGGDNFTATFATDSNVPGLLAIISDTENWNTGHTLECTEPLLENPTGYTYTTAPKALYATTYADYYLTIAGIPVTSANAGGVTGSGISGTVKYNATNRILTLNNAVISTNDNEPSPLIVCNGDLTVNLVGEDNQVYFNGYYGTYVFKNNGATGILTFTGEGTLHINSEYDEGTYIGLCDGFSTVDFGELAYTINGDSKKISPLNISTPMMNVHEGKIDFQTEGYLFGSTTYYKIIYADGSGNEEEVPLTNVVSNQTFDFNNYNEKITISELTDPCTVYAYTKYKEETGASAKAKLFGPASTKQTIVLDADPVELAIVPAIEEGDGIMIYGIESSYVSFDEDTQKATATTMGSGSFPVPLKYTAGQYTTGNTIILNSESLRMQVEVVRDLGIEFVGTNSWASYYATETLAVPEGLTAYVVSAVNEKTGAVTVESVDYIPANNAVLLQRAANGAASGYTAAAYTGTTGTVNNLLSGSAEATDISSIANSPVYVLFNDQFKRATSGTIPARRAYLALGAAVAPSGAPRFMNISIGDGSVTAIKTVAVDDNSNDSWYTIDGLKLNGKPQRKGLYINKGKKMYINNNK